ncbi:MAG: hypothetical protein GY799_24780 [Desulfobulbaceae bacterium]|nr:hypothetical protein [Desulfobulbaceae bacterium]
MMTLLGASGVRHICLFLELTGLDQFIASSYGSQQKVSVQMEESIIAFDEEETSRLAKDMKPKEITVCQDETFHPETCLVAIEPNANFILLEKYSGGRKGSDWTEAMQEAVKELPVKIIQSTSDEGKGILHHVKKGLGAHHSPDIFHVQHEIVKGTSGPLAKKTQMARQTLEKASEHVNRCIDRKVDYDSREPRPGRPPQLNKEIEKALLKETEALQALGAAESHQVQMKQAVHKIGDIYHPVDLETGKLKGVEAVSDSLDQCFAEIETIAAEAQLSERSLKKIKKAKNVVVDMVATVAFFHLTIQRKIEALSLAPAIETIVFDKLIPAFYLRRASNKAKAAEDRHRLKEKSEEIFYSLRCMQDPFSGITREELTVIETVAEECASVFQRSSSCVEGRNGQLSLRHHSFHRLSDRKLAALTAVHNFFIKRNDGTTAAERFFDAKPRAMFEFLLENMDTPGRPAQKRRASKQKGPLQAMA